MPELLFSGFLIFMTLAETDTNIDPVSLSKQEIREKVINRLLQSGVVIPDPVFHLSLDHFIADFLGNESATKKLIDLPEWQEAKRIFITPDRSTQLLRKVAILEKKEVVVTTYGICRGAVLLTRDIVPKGQEVFAASLDGMEHFGNPLRTIKEVQEVGKIDLMVTGALAISKNHGGRTGKGAGWFDAEWIMWRKMGLTSPNTPVAGIVHDLQIVSEAFQLQPWDALVQIIVTPTRVIRTPLKPQPDQIYWDQMDIDWMKAIPLMIELYQQENFGSLTAK